MFFADVGEIKRLLDIDLNNHAEDAKLLLLGTMASAWVEELLDRGDLSLKARTEYYDGTGTGQLLLRSRPVYTSPTIQVFSDSSGYWGAASGSFDATSSALTYGTDFGLKLDPGENGRSRSGILTRLGGTWDRPRVRHTGLLSSSVGSGNGNIKVVYTAGHTLDTLPATFRLGLNFLIARLRYIFPLGVELGSEGYEERSISVVVSEKAKLLALVKPLLWSHRNWRF